jgi:exodeoxyribonuclease VII large subunit
MENKNPPDWRVQRDNYKYQCILADKNLFLERSATKLKEGIELIFRRFRNIEYRLSNKVEVIAHGLKDARKSINSFQSLLLSTFQNRIDWLKSYLYENQKRLQVVDPKHQLKLGYSIASNNGKIIRSIEQVKQGDEVDILVSDGQIKSQVNNIK